MSTAKFSFSRFLAAFLLSCALVLSGLSFSADKGRYCSYEVQRAYGVAQFAVAPILYVLFAAAGISLTGIVATRNMSTADIENAFSGASQAFKDFVGSFSSGNKSLSDVTTDEWAETMDFADGLCDGELFTTLPSSCAFNLSPYGEPTNVCTEDYPTLSVKGNATSFVYQAEQYALKAGHTIDWSRDALLVTPNTDPASRYRIIFNAVDMPQSLFQITPKFITNSNSYNYTWTGAQWKTILASLDSPVEVWAAQYGFGWAVTESLGNPVLCCSKDYSASSKPAIDAYNGTSLTSGKYWVYGALPDWFYTAGSSSLSSPYVSDVPYTYDNGETMQQTVAAAAAAAAEYYASNPVVVSPEMITAASDAVASGSSSGIEDLSGSVSEYGDGILGWLQKIWSAVCSIPNSIVQGLVQPINTCVGAIDALGVNLGQDFVDLLNGIDGAIDDFWTDHLEGAFGGIDEGIADLGTAVGGVLTGIEEGVLDLAESFGTALSGAADVINTGFDTVVSGAADVINTGLDAISGTLDSIWEWLQDLVTTLSDTLSDVFADVLDIADAIATFMEDPMASFPTATLADFNNFNFGDIFPFCLYTSLVDLSSNLSESASGDDSFLYWEFDVAVSALGFGLDDWHLVIDMRQWYSLGALVQPAFILLYTVSVLAYWIKLFLRPLLTI